MIAMQEDGRKRPDLFDAMSPDAARNGIRTIEGVQKALRALRVNASRGEKRSNADYVVAFADKLQEEITNKLVKGRFEDVDFPITGPNDDIVKKIAKALTDTDPKKPTYKYGDECFVNEFVDVAHSTIPGLFIAIYTLNPKFNNKREGVRYSIQAWNNLPDTIQAQFFRK